MWQRRSLRTVGIRNLANFSPLTLRQVVRWKGKTIASPWGDKLIKLSVSWDNEALVAALNAVRLPPRFSAIWHRDTRELEIIFGPLRQDDELRSRSFEFNFVEKRYSCGFRDASDRLLLIAQAADLEQEPGLMDPRNLGFLKFYLRTRDREGVAPGFVTDHCPTSFWIEGIEQWNENVVVDLAQHLNFYMRYFDRQSPLIVIHEDLPAQTLKEKSVRYPHSVFPTDIAAQLLDPFLLGLWESSVRGNPRLRFLYSYQIMEYAAFYHASDVMQQTVRRAILSRHTHLNPARAVSQILDAIASSNQHENEKMKEVVRQSVDPGVIWRELQPHVDFFSKSIQFDGGVTLDPLIMTRWNEEDFARAWHPKFVDQVRKIRNALVHGRQQQMSNVIAPTRANDDRLRPWLAPLSVAAEQVILCRPS